MNTNIKIAILPLNIVTGNCEANLMNVAEYLPQLSGNTDILVLPELFSTGFIEDEQKLTNNNSSAAANITLATLHLWSQRHNVAIAGSYLARIGSKYVNRGFFIEPSGDETFYDKHHLFCLSKESSLYSAGETHSPVIRFRGWNISLAICYDLRFPVWCRNQNQRYDILIIPANWPQSRDYAWRHLLIARAIENQAIVVGANRSGQDQFGTYGSSQIFDPLGKPLHIEENLNNQSPFIYAEYSHSQIDEIRKHLPVANDADNFEIVQS